MNWTFALVNGKISEVFYEHDLKNKTVTVLGHSPLSKRLLQKWGSTKHLKPDIKKYHFRYKNSQYSDPNIPKDWSMITGEWKD